MNERLSDAEIKRVAEGGRMLERLQQDYITAEARELLAYRATSLAPEQVQVASLKAALDKASQEETGAKYLVMQLKVQIGFLEEAIAYAEREHSRANTALRIENQR